MIDLVRLSIGADSNMRRDGGQVEINVAFGSEIVYLSQSG